MLETTAPGKHGLHVDVVVSGVLHFQLQAFS